MNKMTHGLCKEPANVRMYDDNRGGNRKMIIRTQFEIDSCNECWFFETDDYDFKCRLLGDYFCNFNDGYYPDFDVHDEICSKCPFKAEIYDEEKDTIDLDAYQSYMRRKKHNEC